jgi:prepilin-type N-terminal cleavage/methylation domain-containing protein
MKKAFTLVELMVVIVVIAILIGISFKVAGLGEDASKRNMTVARLQRLENALSGYYAAFGSYPPVPLNGRSRNIYYETNGNGIQQTSSNPGTSLPGGSDSQWSQIRSACRAQPIAMLFPFRASEYDYVVAVSKMLQELYPDNREYWMFDSLLTPGRLSEGATRHEWTRVQAFQFGLLSFLLPRYLLMTGRGQMGSDLNDSFFDGLPQWEKNNTLPCRFENGIPYATWRELNSEPRWKIELLPSQIVTTRWLSNLQGILSCDRGESVYGVSLRGGAEFDQGLVGHNGGTMVIFSAGKSQNGGGTSAGTQQYALSCITCKDGWGNEFYYYSPPPYQGYRLWSSGPNGMTFPPWISPEELERMPNKNRFRSWMADDIVHMSN